MVVSEVVERLRLTVLAGGLVTPSSSMLMPWPAGIVSPVLRKQVRVVVLLPKHDPTVALVVVSVTVDLTIVLRLVLVGKLRTIWLLAVPRAFRCRTW